MAVEFKYVSGFVCERTLQEKEDGIYSAIRIVDIFHVPSDAADDATILVNVFVSLKTSPVPPDPLTIRVTLVKPSGERQDSSPPDQQPLILPVVDGDRSIPSGITMVLHILVKVKNNIGTSVVEVDVDDKPALRIPFTLRRLPSAQPGQKN